MSIKKDNEKLLTSVETKNEFEKNKIKLLELFGGIGAPRKALENLGYNIKSIDYVEVLPYAVMAYNSIFDNNLKPQDILLWNMDCDVLVHGSPCFTGDTKVLMADGNCKSIKDIKVGDRISCNGEIHEVTNFWNQGVKDVITLTFSDKTTVTCTPNHKFLCANPNDTADEWITAENLLLENRQIRQNDGSTKRVVSVDDKVEPQEVYDIEVETIHCFVIENGSIVHNCQDWSKNGKNNINTGRSILYERTLQILDPKRKELTKLPKMVLWENVPQLVYKFGDHFNHYLDTMESYGYKNSYAILNAADYGIPQARERVYTVSVLGDKEFEFPKPIELTTRVSDFLDKDVDSDEYNLTEKELSIVIDLPDGKKAVKEATKLGYKEFEDGDVINFEFPGSTTRRGRVGKGIAKTFTTGSRQAVYVDGKLRLFTAKEQLKLMGFSDKDYKYMSQYVTDKQICSLAGNSICIPVLEAIFWEAARQGFINKVDD